jgi:hypothetical protein
MAKKCPDSTECYPVSPFTLHEVDDELVVEAYCDVCGAKLAHRFPIEKMVYDDSQEEPDEDDSPLTRMLMKELYR